MSEALPAPTRFPFQLGVYLATNAISDAVTVVDGPDCAFFKAEFIHGKHDLHSTLLDVMGHHRILVSHVTTDDVATSRGERAMALVKSAAALPVVGLVLVTALPMVSIIGTQYDALLRKLQPEVRATLVEIPGRSLEGDWLDGYEDVLSALARALPEPAGRAPSATGVSVIGYLMDRNEEDHRGNLRELRRMLGALGLELDSTWLGGESSRELGEAAKSGTLLALPLGRRAARAIAERTGARVVDVPTPFGLGATAAFLRAAAEATGRQSECASFVAGELASIAPRLEWAVPHLFLGRRVCFSGAPDLLAGFAELAEELGMEVIELRSPAKRPDWLDTSALARHAPRFDGEPSPNARGRGRIDLAVGDTESLRDKPGDTPAVELGFPSFADHAFVDRPFLGFRGYLVQVQRMASVLGMAMARRRG